MKKLVLVLLAICVLQIPVSASTIKVKSHADFTTENPPQTLEVTAITDLELDEEVYILEGYKLKGDIVDVVSPKRLKRDATFSFVLTEYTDSKGKIHKPDKEFKGKYTEQFDYKGTAKTVALGVGSYFVKGLSAIVALVEGAIKNEEGNRVKSGAISLYESTPISYVEKGEDITIKKNQIFILKFKRNQEEEEDEPNYTFTPPEETPKIEFHQTESPIQNFVESEQNIKNFSESHNEPSVSTPNEENGSEEKLQQDY